MGLLPPVLVELRATAKEFHAEFDGAHKEFDKLAKAGASTGERIQAGMSKGLQVAGTAATGLGLLLSKAGMDGSRAEAGLKQAVDNTGKSFDAYGDRIEKTVSKMARFGKTQVDTDEALSKLTVATKDPAKALDQMGLVADIAARKHISLSEASGTVVRMLNGNAKAFKEYGVNIAKATDTAKVAQAAEERHAQALGMLQHAEERLADFTARMNEQRSQATEQAASRIGDAERSVADATTRVAEVTEDVADRIRSAQQRAAADVEGAAEHQRDAEQRLADLKERLAARAADRATSGSTQSNEEQVAEAQEMRRAQDDLADATAKVADATTKAADAAKPTIDDQRALAKANDDQTAAVVALADEKAKAVDAGKETLAQVQEERRLRAEVSDATAKEHATAVAMTEAQADAASAQQRIAAAMDEVGKRIAGSAEAQRKAMGGWLEEGKARSENLADSLGQKYGPAVTAAGVVAAGFGKVMSASVVSKVVDAAKGFASFGVSGAKMAAEFATNTAEMVARGAVWAASMIASAVTAAASWLASMAAMAASAIATGVAMIIPFLPLILTLGAIGAAVYLLWRNWDTIWGWIKDAAAAVWHFLQAGFDKLVDAFLNFTPLGQIIKHWGDILDFVKGLPGKITALTAGMWDGIKDAFRSAINWLIGKWDSIAFHLPEINVPLLGKIGGQTIAMPQIPLLAKGGTAVGGGLAVVGDAGPEIVDLGAGASVIPLDRAGGSRVSGDVFRIEVPLMLDGRELVRATVEFTHEELVRRSKQVGPLGLEG